LTDIPLFFRDDDPRVAFFATDAVLSAVEGEHRKLIRISNIKQGISNFEIQHSVFDIHFLLWSSVVLFCDCCNYSPMGAAWQEISAKFFGLKLIGIGRTLWLRNLDVLINWRGQFRQVSNDLLEAGNHSC